MSNTYCKTHDCDYDECRDAGRMDCDRYTTTTGEDWRDAKALADGDDEAG